MESFDMDPVSTHLDMLGLFQNNNAIHESDEAWAASGLGDMDLDQVALAYDMMEHPADSMYPSLMNGFDLPMDLGLYGAESLLSSGVDSLMLDDNSLYRIPGFHPSAGIPNARNYLQHQVFPAPATAAPTKRTYKKRKSEGNITALESPRKKLGNKHMSDITSSPTVQTSAKAGLQKFQSAPLPSPRTVPKQTSSFRGVSCCGKDRKWQARIREANRVKYLGRFSTEVEAALVYDEAARQLKGEGAATNFVVMDQEQRKKLVEAFIENGSVIPPQFEHFVRRDKSKPNSPTNETKTQAKIKIPGPVRDLSLFPDSPMAKVKTATGPVISPSSMKSTSQQKATKLNSKFNLNTDSLQAKGMAVPPSHPGALKF